MHELAHIKRRDHVVGWIELIAGLVWWWNPLFWSVRRALREQAELACDAWVISALPNGRRAYAESLLALSSPGSPRPPAAAAVMGVKASSRRVLERRLVMIMNGRASLRLPRAGFLTLALLATATLPAWATGASTEDDSQQTTQATTPTQPTQAAQVKPAPVTQPTQAKPTTPAPAKDPQVKTITVVPQEIKLAPKDVTITKPTLQLHDPEVLNRIHVQVTPKVTHEALSLQNFQVKPVQKFNWVVRRPAALTEEGQKLVSDYSTDVEAIQKEIDAKIAARREAAIKALQALQDQYTKAGKLDEAVAIRDYLKAGGPGGHLFAWIRK